MMTIFALALAAATPAEEPKLDDVRAATTRYKDVKVALADGYVADPTNTCHVAADMGRPPALGGMGIHYVRPDLLGIDSAPSARVSGNGIHTDFMKPSILIYEPNAAGELELVAVENLVFEKAWRATGRTEPPMFEGVTWDHMADDPATPVDEAHGFEPHYDLHVWVHRANPTGMFEPFNPAVTCRHHKATQDLASGHGHRGHGTD